MEYQRGFDELFLIEENIERISYKIEESAIKANKDPREIILVAVTKTVTPEKIDKAIECGIKVIGENRVQEAKEKKDKVKNEAQWHMIGHLQRNKVKYAVELFSMIQSVDDFELAKEIDKRAKEKNKVMDVLIQVNIGNEITKSGITYDKAEELIKNVASLENVKVKGLMAIPPFYENTEKVRPYFQKMYELFLKIKEANIPNIQMEYLSMGMTHDFDVAIEEGANMVRIGTGIFGERKR
ncbi:YggS family pyridoxal phosphate-dependent enzyme [Thermovenabulum sp.]|uniref:YggS family pyridoxal phosphate-dependent enzyme n=1 Tax=Thermovenabulum sp. TaxID=3100335 RepID=UPI003C7B350F